MTLYKLVHPTTKKEVKGVEGVRDNIVFNKEIADYLLNSKGCFKHFTDTFEFTNYFSSYLFQDVDSNIAIKEANLIIDGFGWAGSYEVGEFDVLTENTVAIDIKETEKLNSEMVYNPKVKHKKVKGVKLVVPTDGGGVFKEFFVPYKVKGIVKSKKVNGFVLHFNESGDKDLFKLGRKTKRENLIDSALTCIILYCEAQRVALKEKERVERESRLNLKKRKSNKPKQNEDGTYTVNLDKNVQFIYEKSDVHYEFVRHCEAWNVRGHYRHYRSGKIGFVKPYVKGKGRLNQKNYVV